MRRSLKRMLWAGGISTTCLGLVSFWYFSTAPKKTTDINRKPIAFVQNTKDEIHRRPAKRQIWQSIIDGEPVYSGEAIRTSQIGEVRIKFAEGERYIDLEPESIVVLSQNNQQELSLDLMEGGAVVAAAGGPAGEGPELTMTQGGKKVDLKSGAVLSKSAGGGLEVQVIGDENAKNNLFNLPIDPRLSQFEILSPSQELPTLVDVNPKEQVAFVWKNQPQGVQIKVLAGISRKTLDKTGVSGSDRVSLNLDPGKYFWKLVVTENATQKILGESKLFRVRVANREMPTLLFPGPKQLIEAEQDPMPLTFHWSRSEFVKTLVFEVAEDALFKKKIATKFFDKENEFQQDLNKKDYYVRLSSKFVGEDKVRTGEIQKFSIVPKEFKMGVVAWNMTAGEDTQFFVKEPILNLGWDSDIKKQIRLWRVKLAETPELLNVDGSTVEVSETTHKRTLPKPGRYVAMVEGIDQNSRVIAMSSVKNIDLKPLPLLVAPKLLPLNTDLKANADGEINLKWTQVDGALRYKVRIVDAKGKEIRADQVQGATHSFQDLMPGEFEIQIAALDAHGRYGEREMRKVLVPSMSSVGAPKIKKVKVK